MDIHIADLSLFVDHEQGPFRRAVGTQHTELFRDRTVRPEIGQDGKPEIPHLIRPGKKRGNVVHGDPEKDRVVGFEHLLHDIVAGPLIRTDRRPGGRDKGDHHVLFPPELPERNPLPRD